MMSRWLQGFVAAAVAFLGAAAMGVSLAPVAKADGYWHGQRSASSAPRAYRSRPYVVKRFYNPNGIPGFRGPIRYYNSSNPCTYGDCQCLRGIALRTGNQVWWDRYQACSGG